MIRFVSMAVSDLPTPDGTKDRLSRRLRDLRISITDRCNFRCRYCMPKEVFGLKHEFMPRKDLLSYEELVKASSVFASLGVTKIRITGGEPLLRRNIQQLIAMLAGIPGIEDLSLTTNGSVLTRAMAMELAEAGLQRVTVSLDAIDDVTFKQMNDVQFPVHRVLQAIDHAEAAGLGPVKINMVVKQGVNDHQILPMAEYFRGTNHIVRFIEYMDVGNSNGWDLTDVVSGTEIVRQVNARYALEPIDPNYRGEVAKRWRYLDGKGEIGVITSVTQPFCGACSRARLSAEGKVFTCLFANQGFDLRGLLRSGAEFETLRDKLAALWTARKDRYSEQRGVASVPEKKIEMSYIGG